MLALVGTPACTDPPPAGGTETAAGTDSSTSAEPTPTTSTGAPTTAGTTAAGETDTGAPAALPRGPLLAGAAVGHLTGPVGASMAGYGGRTVTNDSAWNEVLNGAAGFYGLGAVKAIALEVSGERLVLVKLPTMSSEHSLTEGTIDKLKELHGIDLTGRLLTGATHSHHNLARYWRLPAPLGFVGADAPDEEIIDRMTTAIAEVVADAVSDLGPAEWGVAWQDDWDPEGRVYRDRRGENDPTYGKDPRLSVLAVRRPDGAPMAAIANFGMHGTVFDADNELFTEDAPGGVELKFEEAFFAAKGQPIFGMFIQSGGGDASPAGDDLDHPGPARIERIGHAAAPAIVALYDQIEWSAEASLGVRSRRLDLSYAAIGYERSPEFENAQGAPYTWGGWQCTGDDALIDDANPATSLEGQPKDCMPLGTLLESLGEALPNGEVHQTYVTVAALDDFFLVSLPGEPAASVIAYLRGELDARASEARPVAGMAFGYSQDHLLYLTHPDDWYQGGYESEMSLWGPLFAKWVVDRQMEMVDALLAGEGAPVFAEESPRLSVGEPFEPRALEASAAPPGLLTDAPPTLARGQTLRFGWSGGDPALGEPRVIVQVDRGQGFADVPSPSGWPGAALDNSRYHMITHYDPEPEPNGKLLPERAQQWYVDWQAPADLPAGTYRLVARGRWYDGAASADYEVASGEVAVGFGEDASLSATLTEGALELELTLPAPPYVTVKTWPTEGFRLLDPEAGPLDPVHVRAPLTLQLLEGGQPVGPAHELPATSGATYSFDFAATGLASEGLVARVHLRDDVVPAFVEAPVVVP